MSTERQLMVRSKANKAVASKLKEWLGPFGFSRRGLASEASFSRVHGDCYSGVYIDVRNHGLAVGVQPRGFMGFISAERIFSHFREGKIFSPDDPFATGLVVDYMNLTRDPYKSCIVWQYADEEPAVLEQLKDVVMNFILATMEPIKTPDDLIDFQLLKVGETDRFAIGVPGGPDGALRLLTLVRLYRPGIYADVRPRLQGALDWYQPVSDQVKRHLAYIDQPGQLPPLPDRSAWAGM